MGEWPIIIEGVVETVVKLDVAPAEEQLPLRAQLSDIGVFRADLLELDEAGCRALARALDRTADELARRSAP